MIMKMRVVSLANDEVVSVILVNPNALPEPPAGTVFEDCDAEIGYRRVNGEWKKPAPDTSRLIASVRARRDTLLAESDWTQMVDAPVDQEAWREYRQALRDITDQADFPTTVNWPEKPS